MPDEALSELTMRSLEDKARAFAESRRAECDPQQLRARWVEKGYDEQLAEQLGRFQAILAAGGVVGVHPSTWLRLLAYAHDVGADLGGISVRVSIAVPRDAILAMAAPGAGDEAIIDESLPVPFIMGHTA